jgi:hypothetical protein
VLRLWRVAQSISYTGLACGLALMVCLMKPSAAHAAGHNGDAMAGHMEMTALRPVQPGDKRRAAEIVAAARKAADPYKDYREALADGYSIFLPEVKQNVYHFTNNAQAFRNTMEFDPARPTSLLYEKVPAKAGGQPGYKLVGVMYTAPYEVSEDELNRRVPLSIARWHLHTNLCLPLNAEGDDEDLAGPNARFGLLGSITTPEACRAAGGKFMHHVFGWMVHVYPYETDPKKVWASGMDDEHGMQHDAMPADMPME